MDINLSELVKQERLEKGLPTRLTIDGVVKEYVTYKIPLDYLYYNDLNGRIATYIEEYEANAKEPDANLEAMLKTNKDGYNNIIGGYVKESASDGGTSFKKTKRDIQEKGQKLPGVVLDDGRVIDGNRRFTALRELQKETGNSRFEYFEAAILETPKDEQGWRRIKLLELNLQFNDDEKRGYNRIDFLVSFYKDTMEGGKAIDQATYCRASGLKASDYKKNVRIVNVMLDYLEWRGCPKAFYVLKNEKLDGPLEDVAGKCATMSEPEWNEKKLYIYQYLTMADDGDRTRKVRNVLDSAKKNGKLFQELRDKVDNPEVFANTQEVVKLMNKKELTVEETQQLKRDKAALKGQMDVVYREALFDEKVDENRIKPLKILQEISKSLNEISPIYVKEMPNPKAKGEIADETEKIISKLKAIQDAANG